MDYTDNYYRKYFGLKMLDNSCICKEYTKGLEKCYVFFNNNRIVKIIYVLFNEMFMNFWERDVNYETAEDNTIVLPKTSKGKPKKITFSVLENLDGEGTYFSIWQSKGEDGYFIIGNYTTEKSFYEDKVKEQLLNEDDLKKWMDNYINETTEDDLYEIAAFSHEKRKHVNYEEGDYFRVKIGRHEYSYGRILMDIPKRRKMGLKYWDVLMGKPLIVEMFHILTEDKNVPVSMLENLPTFPSQHILNNNFYFGDYEIIGKGKLPSVIKYPIMYGKDIHGLNSKIICFQCGEIYKEIPYDNNIIKRKECTIANVGIGGFVNNGIKYTIIEDKKTIEECIKQKSNKPYWNQYNIYDIRHPDNRDYLLKVLKQFDLEELYDIYKNL